MWERIDRKITAEYDINTGKGTVTADIVFFKQAIKQINSANVLREENLRKIMQLEKSAPVLIALCDYLERKPFISVQEIADVLQISYNTATKYVKMMEDLEMLKQINEQSRYRVFYYDNYIKIFDTKSEAVI